MQGKVLPLLQTAILAFERFINGLYDEKEYYEDESVNHQTSDTKKANSLTERFSKISDTKWNILQRAVVGDIPQRLKSERKALVEILLKSRKFEVNALTSSSQNLLHLFCSVKGSQSDSDENRGIVKLLIENEINFNHKDENGKTALMLACENGNTAAVYSLLNWKKLTKLLYKFGRKTSELDIDAVDNSGETALTLAARTKNTDAFNLITSELFLRATRQVRTRVMERFLNSSRKDCTCCCFLGLCFQRITRRFHLDLAAFETECPSGSSITFSDWLQAVQIMEARDYFNKRSYLELNDQLFLFDKIVHGTTRNGWTALHLAIFQCQPHFEYSNTTIIPSLLYSGKFDVNALTDDLETTLHIACRCRASDPLHCQELRKIIRKLLSQKVNINQRNLFGQTALMIACQNGNFEAVRELLKWRDSRGITLDITAVDNCGQTALMIAKQSNNAAIVAIIEQISFLIAIETGDLDTAKRLLNSPQSDCEYEILYCRPDTSVDCSGQKEESSSLADVRHENEYHNDLSHSEGVFETPSSNCITHSVWLEAVYIAYLKIKQQKSHDDILKLLLDDVRYIHGFNNEGKTVLHVAVEEYFVNEDASNEVKKLLILLNHGKCDINTLNSKTETILHTICNIRSNFNIRDIEVDRLLEILYERNIDVNCRNNLGKTALMIACENGDIGIVIRILDYSKRYGIPLDIEAVDNSDETALMKAHRAGDSDLIDLLRKTLFLAAVESENTNAVKSFLDLAGNFDEKLCQRASSYFTYKSKVSETESWAVDYSMWKEAMHLAIGKSSKDILKLLLDYDFVVRNQSPNGSCILHMIFDEEKVDNRKLFPLTEVLLESGKVNVNAIDCWAQTVLHRFLQVFKRYDYSVWNDKDRIDIIYDAIQLFHRHGANFNQRDKEGKTPLIIASEKGYTVSVRTLLNWAKDTNTWLDLEAKDRNGQTALIKASMKKHTDVVEMLLNAGASVNSSDNRGFTVLHHALLETPSSEFWINFGDFRRNFEELEKRKEREVTFFEVEDPDESYSKTRRELNEDKTNIVTLLLKRPDAYVNALDCEGYSPLDVAKASIPEIPSIVDILQQKGAVLNAFQDENQQLSSNGNLQKPKFESLLHRLSVSGEYDPPKSRLLVDGNKIFVTKAKEEFLGLNSKFQKQLVSAKDQKERTPLHCAIISRQASISYHEAVYFVEMLLSFGCGVNETDIYGRTPLHYADNEDIAALLLSNGADPTATDRDGVSAIEMSNILQDNHHLNSFYSCRVRDLIRDAGRRIDESWNGEQSLAVDVDGSVHWCDHLNPKTISEKLWKCEKYAFHNTAAKDIVTEVTDFMSSLAFEIRRRDPRFESRLLLVGSSNEKTKIDQVDEFDFNFVLTRFSHLCEVSPSPELPNGFVRLRRKETTDDEKKDIYIDSFFNENGTLITEKMNEQFKIALKNVLTDYQFIRNQENFDWNWYCLRADGLLQFDGESKLVTTLKLSKAKLDRNNKGGYKEISIDIVPCIHIDGWWPDETISNIDEDLKVFGCVLVFDWPQRLYPWTPYSESCARISFAPAESEMIKRSSDEAKQAYMIGKQIISKSETSIKTSYLLKTCLLYCIEAFASTSGINSRIDFHLWLESLMKCRLYFASQNFYPCYFMPTFSLPVRYYLKSEQMNCMTDDDYEPFYGYFSASMSYRIVSLHAKGFQMPLEIPILEHFDRKSLITELSKIAFINSEDDSYDFGSQYCDDHCNFNGKSISDY